MTELVTIPRAEYERLLKAEAYVENDRGRSRRNKAKKQAAGPVPDISGDRSNGSQGPVPAISRDRSNGSQGPVPSISRDRSQTPDRSDVRPVATSLSDRSPSRARGGYLFPGVAAAAAIEQQQQRARDNPTGDDDEGDGLWKSPEILAAASRRPGLELEALRIRIAVWLQDEAPAGVRLSRKLVLSFIEHWRPPPIDATAISAKPGDQRIHRNGAIVDAHKYDWLQTSHEDRMQRIAALKAAGA
jgi:hypothetical protein